MRKTVVTLARRTVIVTWVLLVASLIGLAALTHLTTSFVIRGGSMAPAIPIGALILEEPVSPDEVAVGDVITFHTANGVVTHRVVRVAHLAEGTYFEVKGDANRTPDPVLIPATAVIGRVAMHLAAVGYLVAMLGTPSGLLSLLALVATGLLLILLTESLEDELMEDDTRGAALPEGTSRGALA